MLDRRFAFKVVLAAAAVGSLASAYGQFQVELTADKTEVVVGEPVFLTIKVTNPSEHPVAVHTFSNSTARAPAFHIARGRDKRHLSRYDSGLFKERDDPGQNPVQVLQRNESLTLRTVVLYSSRTRSRIELAEPGDHYLQALGEMHVAVPEVVVRVQSPPILIQVREPQEADRAVAASLSRRDTLVALHRGLLAFEDRERAGILFGVLLDQLEKRPDGDFAEVLRDRLQEYHAQRAARISLTDVDRLRRLDVLKK